MRRGVWAEVCKEDNTIHVLVVAEAGSLAQGFTILLDLLWSDLEIVHNNELSRFKKLVFLLFYTWAHDSDKMGLVSWSPNNQEALKSPMEPEVAR